MDALSRNLAYPLWDMKERSCRLKEYRFLSKFQWFDRKAIEAYQLARLQQIMAYAYVNVEFYRQHWPRDPVKKPIRHLEEMAEFPVVEKWHIRDQARNLVSSQFASGDFLTAKTGGSTGTALRVHFDVTTQQKRNGAAILADSWAGWRPGQVRAALWGSPPAPGSWKQKFRRWAHDRIFFLDTMNLSPESVQEFIDQVSRRKPSILFGHAHSIYEMALLIERRDMKIPEFRGIVSTSMTLLPSQRAKIESTFGVKVTDRYGCEEVGLIACECDKHQGLHINEAHVLVEFVRDEGPAVPAGEPVELLVSDFNNVAMPLIRYAVGDEAVRGTRPCPCGRGLALIDRLSGRTADYLVRVDGTRVSGISLVEKTLTAIAGIEQLQIVQEEVQRFLLNLVPTDGYSADSEAQLRTVFERNFGPGTKINICNLRRLPQTARGKRVFSICKVRSANGN